MSERDESAYPFQRGDRVVHPSRPGVTGALEPPQIVAGEGEPRMYVFWDDGTGSRVDPANLSHAQEGSIATTLAERYEAARANLAHLIDHPDKSVSVAEYRAQIKAAQKVNQDAHDAWMGEK